MDEKYEDSFALQRLENQYKDSGFDNESIEMALNDLKNGIDKNIVDCYMVTSLSKEHRIDLALLLKQGLPLDIGKRLQSMDEDQLNEIIPYAKERIPYEAIRGIIMQYSVPHQIKKAFENYKEITKDFAKKVEIKTPSETADTDKTEKAEDTPKEIAEPVSEDETNHIEEPEENNPSETQPEIPAKESVPDNEALIKEIHQVFAESTNTLIENINEKNAGIYADMISRFDDGIQAIVDEIKKDMRENYSLHTPVPENSAYEEASKTDTESVPDPKPTKVPFVSAPEATKEAFAPAPEAVEIKKPRPSYLEDAVSFTRMIRMSDGTLRPLEVERENPKKPKGLLGLASKLFGKDTPQESLLKQLIHGRLSAPQLKQILRAVKSAFSPVEIKDLIESDLDPEEMGNIIDVILADRNKYVEVV